MPDTTDVSWQYPNFVANDSSRSDVLSTYLWCDEGVLFVNRYGYSVRSVRDIEIGAVSTIPTLMGGASIRSGGKTIAWNGHGTAPLA